MDLINALATLGSLPAVELFRDAWREHVLQIHRTYNYYTIPDPLQNSLPNPVYGCYASNCLYKTA